MEEINEIDFKKLLESENDIDHSDYHIQINNSINIDLSNVTTKNKFSFCKFEGERIDFVNPKQNWDSEPYHIFEFQNCEFQNRVFFKDCSLLELKFSDITKSIEYLHLAMRSITFLIFEGNYNTNPYNLNVTINNTKILKSLNLSYIDSRGQLIINNSSIQNTNFKSSEFKRIEITDNEFDSDFCFNRNLIHDSVFDNNKFQKTDFSNSNFGVDAHFRNNRFNDTALFSKIINPNGTHLRLEKCTFKEFSHFNNSKLYRLTIDNCKFLEVSSFQEIDLNSMLLDRTIFENFVFFDDLNIQRIDKCDQRTIRNIKQQLLRADNKIDYDKFRAHELTSYKEDLKKKIKNKSNDRNSLKRDLFILRLNHFYSNNGTDWLKALRTTLILGILFYSLFFISINYKLDFNPLNLDKYFNGLFRFFLITDFYNPLIEEKVYLTKTIYWIPFILGKIFIAIGLYEILISFRKFRK